MSIRKSNRESSLQPKSKSAHWCDHCDKDFVSNWGKCSVCGKRSGKKVNKKPYQDVSEDLQ